MSITIILILITVGASFYAWKNEDIYRKWIMNPYAVENRNEYYRFLTSGFIHADQMHLFVNMISFYFFGRFLEQFLLVTVGDLGTIIYIGFYLLAIVVSEIPTYLKHKQHSWYNSLGASGGVAAVIFSYVIIAPTQLLYLFFFVPVPAVLFGFFYLIYSFYSGKKGADHINHDAHFYGAVFGILCILLIDPSLIESFIYQVTHWKF